MTKYVDSLTNSSRHLLDLSIMRFEEQQQMNPIQIMAKTPKKCFIVSLALLVIGFADTQAALLWGTAKPLGAVFFILFLITYMLNDEVAKYDREHDSHRKPSRKTV